MKEVTGKDGWKVKAESDVPRPSINLVLLRVEQGDHMLNLTSLICGFFFAQERI